MTNDHDITASFTAAEHAALGRRRTPEISVWAYALVGSIALVVLLEYFILPYWVWPLFPALNF